MDFHTMTAYELLEERRIEDVDAMGYVFRHKKSGARVAILSNDDDNKVFYIGFKTPPEDECGVPHIIEHTTLCGSEKYPLKDPFVELVKGSLNTFLNAMTYPEKTVYPIASYNEQDYKNLMDVYLDAVFHPNITKYREIFMQEGWHYELEDIDGELTINGVVYNEMKGAYSSSNEVLQTQIMKSLFPDNAYSRNSGGDPKYIPELTYEKYLALYEKYYHPSNSYIYLYGDLDIAERLEYLDREYLCHYDAQEIDAEILLQKPFEKMVRNYVEYPIASEESEEEQTSLSYNKVVETCMDKELCQAFDVLNYVLVSAPGAPVRQALIDAGIGQDVYGSYETGVLQPMFSIIAKNANTEDEERFVSIIEDTLRKVVAEGLNEKALLAGINSNEFCFREADFGQFPKGLLYGLQCLDSWLYNDADPFLHLECLETFAFLKRQIGTGYYEKLVQKYLLDNTHGSVVVVAPKKGLANDQEEQLSKQLAAYKDGLSLQEKEALVAQTAHLKQYQEEPSTEEELLKIPMLTREDLRKDAAPLSNIEETIEEVSVVRHDVASNGIDYITLMFDVEDIPQEDMAAMAILRSVLGFVDTQGYSYSEFANEVNIYSGGITCGIVPYQSVREADRVATRFEVRIKVLEENLAKACELTRDMLRTSDLTDTKRLGEILIQTKSRLQITLSSSGHTVSALRALSYQSQYAWIHDALNGIAYYQGVCKLIQELEECPQKLIARLQRLVEEIFTRKRMTISFTADTPAYERAIPELSRLILDLQEGRGRGEKVIYRINEGNEAFMDASQIQYVARAGNFCKHGFAYNGYLRILKMILGYDYLWVQIRVKGGAYGCMNQYMRSGESYFVSYRDPNLSRTNEIYEKIPEYLHDFRPDERDMTKYIIGTLGGMDTPLYPEGKGNRSMTAYMQELTFAEIQKERDEILHASPENIREQADLIASILSDHQLCVIGNENMIKNESGLFDRIQGLYE